MNSNRGLRHPASPWGYSGPGLSSPDRLEPGRDAGEAQIRAGGRWLEFISRSWIANIDSEFCSSGHSVFPSQSSLDLPNDVGFWTHPSGN